MVDSSSSASTSAISVITTSPLGVMALSWWRRAVAVWPDYADYQQKTDREIPVFVLTPIH